MKKLLSMILTIAVILSLSVPAFAADTNVPLTDEEVYNRIIALKSTYPEGMKWGWEKEYTHSCMEHDKMAQYLLGLSGVACYAFALQVLDIVFDGATPFFYENCSPQFSYDAIKVGDMLGINYGSHDVIVLTKDATGITVVEGNYNGTVRWGRRISKESLMDENNLFSVLTCRPWTATGTTSRILVNGVEKHAEGYCINGNNYFKLRDLATILSGTSAEFDVVWNNDTERIEVQTSKSYTSVGGECKQSREYAIAYGNNTVVKMTYSPWYAAPFCIGGNNFFRLRDVAAELKTFDVDWDGATNTIIINTK